MKARKKVIETLIKFYETGDLKIFDEYSILWSQETKSDVDFLCGFIEVYCDPLQRKGTFESLVNFKDIEATKRTQLISENAQWFEDNSPVNPNFKKSEVKGVTAKAITIASLGGGSYPSPPIGINLPNSEWIREIYGSKSVNLSNIGEAYDEYLKLGSKAKEFTLDPQLIEWKEKYANLTDNIHTDLHECVGHASGRMLPEVTSENLKSYYSTLEEARADLFGLYYLPDKKLIELGLLPDEDAYKFEYYSYIMNGLVTQLTRIKLGEVIEEAHMRNRQLIAKWVYEKAGRDILEIYKQDGKTYLRVKNFEKIRPLFGELLAEIQRIKSEGDYEAGKNLVETYGVNVDPELHAEVLGRFQKLNLPRHVVFINPVLVPVTDNSGNITDVTVSYDEDFISQNLRYSRESEAL